MDLPGAVSEVHLVVPDGVDDPARPSGGNTYDRRVCRGLATAGWTVHEHHAVGPWPRPDAASEQAMARAVAAVPDGALVLVDGLIASAVPSVLVPEARRLRIVVLVHMLFGAEAASPDATWRPWCRDSDSKDATWASGGVDEAGERAVLSAARAVIVTSRWTRERVLGRYGLPAGQVTVAEPGVDPARLAQGTAGGGRLLCVAAVLPHKGYHELLAALARIADLPWQCTCIGSLALDPAFVDRLRRRVIADGVAGRVHLTGPRTGDELDRAYRAADVLVLASHAETYGMVVTEALARGLPVITTDVGGVADALGHAPDGCRPGVLVPPRDPDALAGALRSWLQDSALRRTLRKAAAERRRTLTGWPTTTERVAQALARVAAR